jgi:hypothetical protein
MNTTQDDIQLALNSILPPSEGKAEARNELSYALMEFMDDPKDGLMRIKRNTIGIDINRTPSTPPSRIDSCLCPPLIAYNTFDIIKFYGGSVSRMDDADKAAARTNRLRNEAFSKKYHRMPAYGIHFTDGAQLGKGGTCCGA